MSHLVFQYKMTRSILGVVFVFATPACSQVVAPSELPRPILSDKAWDMSCEPNKFDIDRGAYSPDNFDQDFLYEHRYSTSSNKINYPIPILCIYKIYGSKKINYWVSKNDVVAKYILFQINFVKNCEDVNTYASELKSIGGYKFKNKYGIYMSRLPESYEVLARIQIMCGLVGDSDASSKLAFDAGYEPHMTYGE